MGSATIDSETGEGLYTVTVDTGTAEMDAKIATLNNRLATLEASTIDLLNDKVAKQNAVNDASSALNNAINAYAAAISGGGDGADELGIVKEKTILLADASSDLAQSKNKYNQNQASIASTSANIDYLSGFDLDETKDAWCVDYTLEAAGEVATIEIPGEPVNVVLAPDCPAPIDAVDGVLTARVAQDANQLYLNLALLPGWQKFSPTYRLGVITSIDRENHTCNLDLDAATSSAQNLDINQDTSLLSVPIEYMTCNSLAFSIFDRVVVQFTGQSWDQPKVIGFESNPVPCSILTARYHTDKLAGPILPGERWYFTLGIGVLPMLDTLRGQQNPPGYPQTEFSFQILVRPDGDSTWWYMPNWLTVSHKPGGTPSARITGVGAGDYFPVIWAFDGEFAGSHTSRNLFEVRDCQTTYVDWSTFLYTRDAYMAYDITNGQDGEKIIMIQVLADQFDRYANEPIIYPGMENFDSDLMEIRVITQSNDVYPDVPDAEWAHFTIKRSTRQVYGANAIDILTPAPTEFASSRDITELTGYSFPPG